MIDPISPLPPLRNPVTELRSFAARIYDAAVTVLAWIGAFGFRFNFQIPFYYREVMIASLVVVLPVAISAFTLFGLYRGIWRFASIPDLRRLSIAVLLTGFGTNAIFMLVSRGGDIPRSVILLYPILLVMLMGGGRFIYRAWKDGHVISLGKLDARPVIVLGAGMAAAALVKSLVTDPKWTVVAFLDDDPSKHGRRLHGLPIAGPIGSLDIHAARYGARQAILAIPSATANQRRKITELAVAAGIEVLTVPSLSDVMDGRVSVSKIRPVELEDLLGRDPVQLDTEGLHRLINGATVMVTGAGGSIGAELCRQIQVFGPQRVIMVDHSEYALYRIEQEFSMLYPPESCVYTIADVKDEASIDGLVGRYHPTLIFHAAAYKHVPMMEGDNAWQAIRNNVLGTHVVAKAAIRHGVRRFVLISTDKAVNPTNVMGASKRLAELNCLALQKDSANDGEGSTKFVIVRFGNVLGSSGSVIPKFREQIANGGPVTVTHPDIVRYFMLIPEAAQLVLQAGIMGKGGEIFVLDMGEPIRIVDLATDMIRLSGLTIEEVPIVFTGLRPGEKLYEELLADSETTLPTPYPKLRIAASVAIPDRSWQNELEVWIGANQRTESDVKADLLRWVIEYRPLA